MFLAKSLHTAAVIAALLLALMMVGCPPSPAGPEAEFVADVTSGAAPLTVQFNDVSYSGTSSITSWSWLFGDGWSSGQQDPAHTYTGAGTYNVSLTVTTADGVDTELKLNFITTTPSGEGEGEGEGEFVTVPNLMGLTESQADSVLTGVNLWLGWVYEDYSDIYPVGVIISQDPAAFTQVAQGAWVDDYISIGPARRAGVGAGE